MNESMQSASDKHTTRPSFSKIAKSIGQKLATIQSCLQKSQTNNNISAKSQQKPKSKKLLKIFKCRSIPKIDLPSFVKRFIKKAALPDEVLVLGYILFNRSMERARILNTPFVTHKLFTACVFVSHKFLIEDGNWGLKEFSRIGGISEKELFKMEISLTVDILQFEIYTDEREYSRNVQDLLKICPKNTKEKEVQIFTFRGYESPKYKIISLSKREPQFVPVSPAVGVMM